VLINPDQNISRRDLNVTAECQFRRVIGIEMALSILASWAIVSILAA
jgi:hypothetical protein